MDVLDGGPVESLVGFFDVQFRGSPENPTDSQVRPSHAQPCHIREQETFKLVRVNYSSSHLEA